MSKKLTRKEIRERDEKAVLYDRLWDLAVGAFGGGDPEDDPENSLGVWSTLGCENMGRFIGAVEWALNIGHYAPKDEKGNQDRQLKCVTSPHHLHEWETLDKLTDYLYRIGVRA